MVYLKLPRPVNLLMIVLIQLVVKFGLFDYLNVTTALSPAMFVALMLATVFIAAGGNVINDIYDISIDRINKPKKVLIGTKISEKAANNLYIALTFIGVSLGFIVANSIGKPSMAAIFIIIAGLLYAYASHIKSILLISNLLISVLVAMVLLIIIIFDIFPAIQNGLRQPQLMAAKLVLHYAIFAFYINFIREIVKDLQDINGDKNGGRTTLPIAIGRKRTVITVFILGGIALVILLIYMYTYLYQYPYVNLYFLLALVAPLLFFEIKTWNAETNRDYALLSTLLKSILFLGILSILMYQFVF